MVLPRLCFAQLWLPVIAVSTHNAAATVPKNVSRVLPLCIKECILVTDVPQTAARSAAAGPLLAASLACTRAG
jgi:hypothetical protein